MENIESKNQAIPEKDLQENTGEKSDPEEKQELLTFIQQGSFGDVYKVVDSFWKREDKDPEIVEALLDRFVNSVWKQKPDSYEKFNLYHDFFYDHFPEYQDLISKKLDLQPENAFENVCYLDFLEDLHEFSGDYWQDTPGRMKEVIENLEKKTANKDSSYFLSLKGSEVLDKIKQKAYKDYVERQEEIERTAKEKYGQNWEEELEKQLEKEEQELPETIRERDHAEQEPFLIAPRIYAWATPEGFIISEEKDYEKVSELIEEYEEALNEEMVADEDEGPGCYVQDDEAVHRIIEMEAKMERYFKHSLEARDMTIIPGAEAEQSKEKFFYNYRFMASPQFRDKIEQELGVNLSELDFKYQFYFLQAAINRTNADFKEFKNYLEASDNKKDRIKSFLTLEADSENGQKLLEIAEKIDSEVADKIFSKIAEISDLAVKKDKELSDLIYKDRSEKLPENIHLELLNKINSIITEFSSIVNAEKSEGEIQKKINDLLKKLEEGGIDMDLLASLLIAAKKGGDEEDLNNIKGVEVAEEEKLSEDLEGKMKRMYAGNHAEKSEEETQRLLEGFDEHKKHDPKYYLLYFDKENKNEPDNFKENLVGFVRSSSFDGENELAEKERYLGALNIDPLMHKFYLGENFLRQAVESEFESGAEKIIAHVPEGAPSHKSCELLGFKSVEQEGEYKDKQGRVLAPRIRIELEKRYFIEKEEAPKNKAGRGL